MAEPDEESAETPEPTAGLPTLQFQIVSDAGVVIAAADSANAACIIAGLCAFAMQAQVHVVNTSSGQWNAWVGLAHTQPH